MAKIKAKKSEVKVETKKDIKKRQKAERIKIKNEASETEVEIRRFVAILAVVLFLIAVVYFFTKNSNNKNENTVEIQYNDISVGMILNRNEYSEYYVLAYFENSEKYTEINKLYKTYRNRDNSKKLYTVNMDDQINSKFVSANKDNRINVTNAADFLFSTDTLLYIKDGKIVKTYDTYKAIEEVLK